MAKRKKKPSDPTNSEAPIADPQEKFGKSPTEESAAWLWIQLEDTRGGRFLGLVLVALAVVGWLVTQPESFGKIRAVFKTPNTYATSDEITCLNGWVLKLEG